MSFKLRCSLVVSSKIICPLCEIIHLEGYWYLNIGPKFFLLLLTQNICWAIGLYTYKQRRTLLGREDLGLPCNKFQYITDSIAILIDYTLLLEKGM